MTTARPESFWEMEDSYKPMYQRYVELGRLEARKSKVAIVCIARNAMPYAVNTLELIDELAGEFREAVLYAYENDSVDGTDKALDAFAATSGACKTSNCISKFWVWWPRGAWRTSR